MPQITVDYSETLESSFDRRGFALALHPLIVETVDTKLAACKSRFRRVDETVVAGGTPTDAVIHIGIALLAGRAPELKAQLSETVLDLLAEYIRPVDGVTPTTSVEVRDLEPSYRKR
jgi:5-carboxymethyl-2-hydroxymuconate isomerase